MTRLGAGDPRDVSLGQLSAPAEPVVAVRGQFVVPSSSSPWSALGASPKYSAVARVTEGHKLIVAPSGKSRIVLVRWKKQTRALIAVSTMSASGDGIHGVPADGMCCLCTMEDITVEDGNYGKSPFCALSVCMLTVAHRQHSILCAKSNTSPIRP